MNLIYLTKEDQKRIYLIMYNLLMQDIYEMQENLFLNGIKYRL